jgi:hypothetical protein
MITAMPDVNPVVTGNGINWMSAPARNSAKDFLAANYANYANWSASKIQCVPFRVIGVIRG